MLDLLLVWGLRGICGTITQENNKKMIRMVARKAIRRKDTSIPQTKILLFDR